MGNPQETAQERWRCKGAACWGWARRGRMRVVVVDAFGCKAEDRALWREFRGATTKAVRDVDLGGVKIEVVRLAEVRRLVYDEADPKCGTEGMRELDRVDMFCIGCQPNLFPWEEAGRDLAVLLRMCFVTSKVVFGSGALGHFLGYLCCTRGLHLLPVNGPAGSELSSLDAHAMAAKVRDPQRDVFLDCATGDTYMFKARKGRWVPYTNVGSKLKSGKEPRVTRHVARVAKPLVGTYFSKSNETICFAEGRTANHWLLRGIEEVEFVVRSQSKWMLDADSNLRSKHQYETILRDRAAPLLVRCRNFVAAHFDISARYPQTLMILQNFVRKEMRRIQQRGSVDRKGAVYLNFQTQLAETTEDSQAVARSVESRLTQDARTRAEAAHASECVFLQNRSKEYKVVRSNKDVAKLRAKQPVKSTRKRQSNFAANDGCDFKTENSLAEQALRLRKVKETRARGMVFCKPRMRPCSAPMHKVHSASTGDLRLAYLRQDSKEPVFDATDHRHGELTSNPLATTHNFRTFKANPALARAKSATTLRPQTAASSSKQREKLAQSRHVAKQQRAKPRLTSKEEAKLRTIRADGPFKSQFDLERAEYFENKSKWLSQQVFSSFVGPATLDQRTRGILSPLSPTGGDDEDDDDDDDDAGTNSNVPGSPSSKKTSAAAQSLAQARALENPYLPVSSHKFREESSRVWMR
ncbi:Uncharacterized protein SCF082_LOCUS15275 [Durusdinium trenchii]|uniref:Uncharacterized protein n=1 Tax=Durusdinium trenchii TaxID=1381693 RepID=A0ABP0K3C7_9DINO